jgi:succinyl-CoA synthetase alpha subunit
MEAADAGIKVIIALQKEFSVADMIKANAYVKERNAIIGPNCPGVINSGEAKLVSCQVSYSKKEL